MSTIKRSLRGTPPPREPKQQKTEAIDTTQASLATATTSALQDTAHTPSNPFRERIDRLTDGFPLDPVKLQRVRDILEKSGKLQEMISSLDPAHFEAVREWLGQSESLRKFLGTLPFPIPQGVSERESGG